MNRYQIRHKNYWVILILINLGFFFLPSILPHFRVVVSYMALSLPGLKGGLIWTPLTYFFVHANMQHLLFNMLPLFFFGPPLEERMGSRRFLSFYLMTGILSGIFSIISYRLLLPHDLTIIGASGAIYATLFAFAVFYPRATIMLYFVIPVKAPVLIFLGIGLSLYSQFFSYRGSNVAHLTHLSGILFSYLYLKFSMKVHPIRELLGEH